MKPTLYFLFLLVICLTGCSSPTNKQIIDKELKVEEASWAYEFVKYNGVSYLVTDEEIEPDEKGNKVGEVLRNVVDLDTEAGYKENEFDSNSLEVGTPLYKHKSNDAILLYEFNGKLYKAEKE